MSWLRRLRNRWRERDLAREFDDELQFHLESRTAANVRRGLDPSAAAEEARRHMGNLTRVREEMRAARVATWLDGLGGDLRYAYRVLGRQPLLTVLVVATLSLGIGANAAIFSVFQAVLLRPLPYPGADRLVLLLDGRRGERGFTTPTIPEVLELRAASRSFDVVSFFDTRDFQIDGADEPLRVVGARVDAALLPMLGVRPAYGRLFQDADGLAGNTVILGDGMWRRNFGGDPAVIGRPLKINGGSFEIVGVLPDSFSPGYLSAAAIDLYIPYPSSPEYTSRSGEFASVRRVNALARLAPDGQMRSASAELRTIAAAMAVSYPAIYKTGAGMPDFTMSIEPLRESLTQSSRPVLFMLLGAVGLVLVIACANTAQFLLAQAIEREPEVAVRSALGATRARLLRQFAVEAVVLAAAAGVVGAVQAVWLTRALRSLVPRGTLVVGGIGLDVTVLLFLAGVTVTTALLCAAIPALRFSRPGLIGRLDTRGAGGGRGRLRLALIAAEVAMSLILLVGAALLLRSLQQLQRAQGGFSADRVAVLRIRGMSSGPALGDTYARYVTQISAIAGIDAVGAAAGVFPGRPATNFTLPGSSPDAAAAARQQTSYQIVSGGFFRAMGIPLEAGRLFTDDDTARTPRVAVVNRDMAERFWPGESPIGKSIRAGEGPRDATMTIVGVVGNVRPPFQVGDVPQLYVSYRQQSEPNMALVIKTSPGTALPIVQVKEAIWSVDSRQAVFGVGMLADQLAAATSSQRALTALIGGFAVLAVAMSLAGIYTVITYLVSRRFKEIAVRRAIGATGRDVVWSLAGPTVAWTIVGLALGAAGAGAGAKLLRTAVTGVLPLDAPVVTAAAAAYLTIVVLAIAAASRGALRINPAAALRAD